MPLFIFRPVRGQLLILGLAAAVVPATIAARQLGSQQRSAARMAAETSMKQVPDGLAPRAKGQVTVLAGQQQVLGKKGENARLLWPKVDGVRPPVAVDRDKDSKHFSPLKSALLFGRSCCGRPWLSSRRTPI
ncbi:MAG: hypothetical protein CSA62_09340 [Planctomycetota bacterium]|nr:MAG: hypothetical protein CSA62_09340 [Planctomycetota bacterium]